MPLPIRMPRWHTESNEERLARQRRERIEERWELVTVLCLIGGVALLLLTVVIVAISKLPNG